LLMNASGGTFSIRRRKYWKRTSERNKDQSLGRVDEFDQAKAGGEADD
jgi:hypothetical protein